MSKARRPSAPIPPGATIGILGGGQLGRMLSLAGARLGFKTHIFCDDADAPAFQVASFSTRAKYDARRSLEKFARSCQAITFEFENVPAEALTIVGEFAPVSPGVRALEMTQDRLEEKKFVTGLGLRTPTFVPAQNEAAAGIAFGLLRGPRAILKTRRLGYDGKGQSIVASAEEAAAALRSFHGAPSILEQFVEFEFEASVVAARSADGTFAAYDPPENVHGDHILRRSTVPSRMTKAQCEEAIAATRTIADALEYVGVLAVEFFVTPGGALLVNEIAPRVHNSGHWTLEACVVSQFEQHVRAVAGWPLGDPSRHSDAVMENIIGEEFSHWPGLAARRVALHLYGKSSLRPGRKLGHFTTLSPLSGQAR
jgi:5-(carboxyamino)imidazole ribonucleotide synthase